MPTSASMNHFHMIPTMSHGAAQGMIRSVRANPLPQNRSLRSRAKARPSVVEMRTKPAAYTIVMRNESLNSSLLSSRT